MGDTTRPMQAYAAFDRYLMPDRHESNPKWCMHVVLKTARYWRVLCLLVLRRHFGMNAIL
jgi:hypothetical protein